MNKILIFDKVKCIHKETYRAYCPILRCGDNLAFFEIYYHDYDKIWWSSIFYGNQGHTIGNYQNLQFAEQSCIDYLFDLHKKLEFILY